MTAGLIKWFCALSLMAALVSSLPVKEYENTGHEVELIGQSHRISKEDDENSELRGYHRHGMRGERERERERERMEKNRRERGRERERQQKLHGISRPGSDHPISIQSERPPVHGRHRERGRGREGERERVDALGHKQRERLRQRQRERERERMFHGRIQKELQKEMEEERERTVKGRHGVLREERERFRGREWGRGEGRRAS